MFGWLKRRGGTGGGDDGGATAAPDLPLDVTGSAFLAAPETTYAALRADHPACPLQRGGVMLTRHADVRAALVSKDLGNVPSRFSVLHPGKAGTHVAANMAAQTLPFLDGPLHRSLRQAVSRAFYNVFNGFEATLARETDRSLGTLRGAGPVDLVTGPARDFACRAIAAFVGAAEDPAAVKEISDAFFRLFAPVRDADDFAATNERLSAARARMAGWLADRRRDGARCLLTELSALQDRVPDLTDARIVDNAILVLSDGVENIEAGIGQAMTALADAPDAPDEETVREVLRLHTPAQMIPRVCLREVTLHGQLLAPGSPVFLALGSANRDPAGVEAPAEIRAGRPRGAALTFGGGRHGCIGEPLAVAMIGAYCRALHTAGARIDAARATYEPVFGHRWIREVRITVPGA